jgi:hypothetical protein
MPDILKDYFEALERLKKGRPECVPKGTKITNDSVSLEAGRKKGTIKRSRPIFKDLIEAINAVETERPSPLDERTQQLETAKAEAAKYRVLWEEALTREVSLFKQLWDERTEWAAEKAALTGEKVSTTLRAKLKDRAIRKGS